MSSHYKSDSLPLCCLTMKTGKFAAYMYLAINKRSFIGSNKSVLDKLITVSHGTPKYRNLHKDWQTTNCQILDQQWYLQTQNWVMVKIRSMSSQSKVKVRSRSGKGLVKVMQKLGQTHVTVRVRSRQGQGQGWLKVRWRLVQNQVKVRWRLSQCQFQGQWRSRSSQNQGHGTKEVLTHGPKATSANDRMAGSTNFQGLYWRSRSMSLYKVLD